MVDNALSNKPAWFSYKSDTFLGEKLIDSLRNKWRNKVEVLLLMWAHHRETSSDVNEVQRWHTDLNSHVKNFSSV